MAQCTCGNQDLTYKSGLSKKTGKKWQGFKCEACNIMYGMDGVAWGSKPQNVPVRQEIATKTAPVGVGIEAKIDKILAILKENFPPVTTEVIGEEENSPF